MICKKCGATISDTSKFCGYCGAPNKEDALNSNQVLPEVNINNLNNGVNVNPVSPVDTLNETSVQKNNLNSGININPVPPVDIVNPASVQGNSLNNGININPVSPVDIVNPASVQGNNLNSGININPVSPVDTLNETSVQGNSLNSGINVNPVPPVDNNLNNGVTGPTLNQPIENNDSNKKKNGGSKLVIAILIALICVGIVGYLVFTYMKKGSGSVTDVKKALANLSEKKYSNGTITLKLEGSSDEQKFDVTGVLKFESIDNSGKAQITLNSNLLSGIDISLYALVNNNKADLYIPSTIIDLMGTTKSPTSIWTKVSSDSIDTSDTDIDTDIFENFEIDETTINNFKLDNFISEKNIKYVSTKDGLKKYQIIIDKELINKIYALAGSSLDTDLGTEMDDDTINEIAKYAKIYLYIDNSNYLKNIEISFTDPDSKTNLKFEIGYDNLGSTTVDVPVSVTSGAIDINEYITKYTIATEDDNF